MLKFPDLPCVSVKREDNFFSDIPQYTNTGWRITHFQVVQGTFKLLKFNKNKVLWHCEH